MTHFFTQQFIHIFMNKIKTINGIPIIGRKNDVKIETTRFLPFAIGHVNAVKTRVTDAPGNHNSMLFIVSDGTMTHTDAGGDEKVLARALVKLITTKPALKKAMDDYVLYLQTAKAQEREQQAADGEQPADREETPGG